MFSSQVKSNWDLSSSLQGIIKNMSLTSKVAIHNWEAAFIAVAIEVILGTAAVHDEVTLFNFL